MLSYRLKVSSPYSPENVLIPTKSENLKEPPPKKIAAHFEEGRQHEPAILHLIIAAETASRR
jgi:hypothetical protein